MVRKRQTDHPMMNVIQVADRLNVHPNTVKRLPIPYYQVTPRGDRRYHVDDVEAWLKSNRMNGADHADHV